MELILISKVNINSSKEINVNECAFPLPSSKRWKEIMAISRLLDDYSTDS